MTSSKAIRFTLLGVGAMASPRYAPAGLLIEHGGQRVMIDGGPGAQPHGELHAWLLTDEQGELAPRIRKLARARGLQAHLGPYRFGQALAIPRPVVHTSHPTCGYLVRVAGYKAAWAPEFLEFPDWAAGSRLMFAEAAGWSRPIRFAGGAGGHASLLEVSRQAQARGVRRLVFAHIGRPTLKALDAGERPGFGELGEDGAVYVLGRNGSVRRRTRQRG